MSTTAGGDGEKIGTLRLRAADEADFLRYLQKNSREEGLYIPAPQPPFIGTLIQLEVLYRGREERICGLLVRVDRSYAQGYDGRPPGMFVRAMSVEPGVGEDLRRELQKLYASDGPLGRLRSGGIKPTPSSIVIGIDLGTTYSCAAVVDPQTGQPRVIHSSLGYNTVPSVLTFDDSTGLPIVGQIAERRMVLHPERVVYGSKRFIGRPLTKALSDEVSRHMRYEVISDADGMAAVRVCGRTLSPIEVAACVLAELRKVAEAEMHREVQHAVITVPAAFTENQRAAVREAGARAGLSVLRIVSEPTAATLAYGYGRTEQKTVLVYDLGGGTFDVSILRLNGSTFTVLGSAGDTFLGGLDFDQLLASAIYKDLMRQHPQARIDRLGEERIMGAARDAKHQLSTTTDADVQIPMLTIAQGAKPIEFQTRVTRKQLEQLSTPLIDRTIDRCDEALRIAGLKAAQVEDVLLVGGQTRMPIIQQRLHEKFRRPPSKRVHPDEVVAIGAAVLATTFKGGDAVVLVDVLPLPIGIGQPDGSMKVVLERNAALPASGTTFIASANGKALEVTVFQGESAKAWDNECLGSFLTAGARGASGALDIEIDFLLDNEGLLTIRSRVRGGPPSAEVMHRLTTQLTSDDLLAKMGAERVVPRPAFDHMPPPPAPGATPPASAPRKGFFERFTGGFFDFFRRKKK